MSNEHWMFPAGRTILGSTAEIDDGETDVEWRHAYAIESLTGGTLRVSSDRRRRIGGLRSVLAPTNPILSSGSTRSNGVIRMNSSTSLGSIRYQFSTGRRSWAMWFNTPFTDLACIPARMNGGTIALLSCPGTSRPLPTKARSSGSYSRIRRPSAGRRTIGGS
jgi:hypothetical protein